MNHLYYQAKILLMLLTTAALALSSSLSSDRSHSAALSLVNHPLAVQLGTGALPRGSFDRCMLARRALLQSLEACAARAVSSEKVTPAAALLFSTVAKEVASIDADAAHWASEATSAGQTIDLPAEEVAAGVKCYVCGGNHYNIDCPDELSVSGEAQALASFLRAASPAASATVLRDLAFVHKTLLRAGLDGGRAYGGVVRVHAERWTAMAEQYDALESDGAPAAEIETARALLFAAVDAEGGVAGLKDAPGVASGSLSLEAAREAIERVEPGFLAQQDRNAAFVRERVLGSPPQAAPGGARSPGPRSPGPPEGLVNAKAKAKLDKAADYLRAKQASSGAVGKDAAAVLAAKGPAGAKQAAAKRYLELRGKQQKAAAYLAARKRAEGDEAEPDRGSSVS